MKPGNRWLMLLMFSESRVDDDAVLNNVLFDNSLTSPSCEGLTRRPYSLFKLSLKRIAGAGEGVQ